ncbi:MAG: OmpH family outer membrane protein [Pseudomonadota bacterium]
MVTAIKRLAAILAVVLAMAWLLPAVAAAEGKVGIVDIQRAVSETDAGKRELQKLDERVKKMQAEIDSKKKAVEKAQVDLKTQGSVLSAEAVRDKKREIERQNQDLTTMAQDYQEDLAQAQQATLAPLLKGLADVIEKMGQEQGFSVILERQAGVVFFTPAMDVTAAVVKAYNEKNKQGGGK